MAITAQYFVQPFVVCIVQPRPSLFPLLSFFILFSPVLFFSSPIGTLLPLSSFSSHLVSSSLLSHSLPSFLSSPVVFYVWSPLSLLSSHSLFTSPFLSSSLLHPPSPSSPLLSSPLSHSLFASPLLPLLSSPLLSSPLLSSPLLSSPLLPSPPAVPTVSVPRRRSGPVYLAAAPVAISADSSLTARTAMAKGFDPP